MCFGRVFIVNMRMNLLLLGGDGGMGGFCHILAVILAEGYSKVVFSGLRSATRSRSHCVHDFTRQLAGRTDEPCLGA